MGNDSSQNNILQAIHTELFKIKDSDRNLAVVTNTFLELLVNKIIEKNLKNAKAILEDNRTFTYYTKLMLLHEKNLIDEDMFNLLNKFRKVRNRASHDAVFNIQQPELKSLDSHFRHLPNHKDGGFVHTCTRIIGSLWNMYRQIFGREFAGLASYPEDGS